MEIHARFVPKIGIGYGARDTDIFVKMLESEGLTKRAGIQEGDIIKSINGKTPKTIPEAIGMIREYEIGAEIPVVVERRNEQKEVAIQNDW